jgi:regulator of protease activity HflC (stomatin/prohibitin superfamily)
MLENYNIREYERAVVLRFGRIMPQGSVGPGPISIINGVDNIANKIVDLRERVEECPPLKTLTADRIPIELIGVLFYEIFDPVSSVVNVKDVYKSVKDLSISLLRDALSSNNLVDFLRNKKALQLQMKVNIYLLLYIFSKRKISFH